MAIKLDITIEHVNPEVLTRIKRVKENTSLLNENYVKKNKKTDKSIFSNHLAKEIKIKTKPKNKKESFDLSIFGNQLIK